MIQANNIVKSFGDLTVLKGIDISVAAREIVSIMGPSGAGKTTLLQILGTLSRPTSGKLVFNGVDINGLSEKRLARFRNFNIGFVFQFHHLLPEFTALENVCIPAFLAKKSKKETEKKAKEILEKLDISHRLHHKPSELSGGEQQRVAVARALINDPGIILADEPSGNLDMENKKQLHELFFNLRDTFGQTFIIVTHNNQLANMADRKLILKDGDFVS